jgi:hypothetical protein
VHRPTPLGTRPAYLNGQRYCSDLLHNRDECERIDPLTYLESASRERKRVERKIQGETTVSPPVAGIILNSQRKLVSTRLMPYQADGTSYSKCEENGNNEDLGCSISFKELYEESSVVDGCVGVITATAATS